MAEKQDTIDNFIFKGGLPGETKCGPINLEIIGKNTTQY